MNYRMIVVICLLLQARYSVGQHVKIGSFHVDATPPIGSPVAYAMARSIADPLSARGIVILSDQKPIVLCAVDWIGISNEGQDVWRQQLARAAQTTVDRVSVHALHQHDGVRCDFTIERILQQHGLGATSIDNGFVSKVIGNVSVAVTEAVRNAQQVTHVGFGQAKVDKVASNRRILGNDGRVAIIRWSSSTDTAAINAPEGLIDPWLKSVSFWNKNKPLAVLSYYTTHPQSYYGDGDVSCEFIGIARNAREQALSGVPHINFNGASGNISAGKYNDGSVSMRPVLASRVEQAMKHAWESTRKTRIHSGDLAWKNIHVQLPLGKNIVEKDLEKRLSDQKSTLQQRYRAAEKLAWYHRSVAGEQVNVSSLRLGQIWLLNLPGELFVEYQLAAQKMRPLNEHVCTAAYEEYGPGYIGTRLSYTQGGYETSDIASGVAPEVEDVLMNAIRQVLK